MLDFIRKNMPKLFDDDSPSIVHRSAYSPDPAPSDFWSFGNMKVQMPGQSFHTTYELLNAINRILVMISRATIIAVFRE
jgi:hypothetical protein